MDYETLRNSMTVQDAARVLKETNCYGTMDIAKSVILRALEQPSEDWNAVLDELNRIGRNAFKDDTDYDYLFDFISNLPNVKPQSKEEPQQKTGHWIEHKHGGIEHIECSKCKCWFLKKYLIRNSYCPNCGSRNHWEWE